MSTNDGGGGGDDDDNDGGGCSYLKQKNDVERDFREQKLTTEENIKTRQEVQEVLADMERKARLVQLEVQADNYAAEIEATKGRVEDVKRNIAQSASAIQRFRAEFEQMRAAIMLNKTVKSSQVRAGVRAWRRLRIACVRRGPCAACAACGRAF